MYDIKITADALQAAAAWVQAGENMADVELLADDRMLLVTQGDERNAFDTGGEPASAEYLAVAPLDVERGLRFDEDELEMLASVLTGIDTYTDDDPVVALKAKIYPATSRAWLLDDE